ncbi:MAG TPA: YihY/virulence factor BrkB family protein [Puia sp.]|nr:YihY/virulence factor BrkB family protein [Puia sp.]
MIVKKIKTFWQLFKKAFFLFIHYHGLKLSASLSFYTVFSVGPFLIIIISLAGIFFGKEAVEGKVYGEISGLIGSDIALQVQDIIRNIQKSNHSTIGSILGFVILLIGASSVFSEIHESLNHIWSVKAKPKKVFFHLVIRRLLSFSLLLGMAFLLLVSLLVNALADVLSEHLKSNLKDSIIKSFYSLNLVLIFVVVAALFAVIFKILPNTYIRWKDAITGALFTSVLFLIGKFLIGFYLGNSSIGATYGAAAAIVVLMVWVYYSSIILYFGACFTRVYANHRDKMIRKPQAL